MADEEAFHQPAGPSKNPQGKHVGSKQRLMAFNLYLDLKQDNSKSAAIKITAKQLGLSERTVWDVVKEMDTIGLVSSPPKNDFGLQHMIPWTKRKSQQLEDTFILFSSKTNYQLAQKY